MEDRSKMYGIGASDVPTILGINPFQTPLELFNRLTGISEPVEQSEAMYWGKKHEQTIAERFSEDHGVKLMAYKKRYHSKKCPFFSCELDRIIVSSDTVVECKSVTAYKAKEWGGSDTEMPSYIIAQVMAQLGLSERKSAWVACLIGGNDYREKFITFDAEFYNSIEEKAIEFWSMVESNTPPMVMLGDDDAILALHPKNNEEVQSIEEMNASIALLQETKAHIKTLEDEKGILEVKLKEVIGSNLGVKTSKYLATWKEQKSSRVDIDAMKKDGVYEGYLKQGSTRVLRIALNKKEGK